MKVFYNEFDPNAAEWLRNLGAAGQIAKGVVNEQSIKDLRPEDVAGYTRAHFFAGIGGWDYALRLAGWPEDREVWTGSCPCQPFSAAGKGKGTADERHLWPEFFRLISERRPEFVFGEQVAGKAGLGWLDGVLADLEGIGYSCGAAVIGAHSVGAPHIRQRLYWGASIGRLAQDPPSLGRRRGSDGDQTGDDGKVQTSGLGAVGGVANNNSTDEFERPEAIGETESARRSVALRLGDGVGDDLGRDSRGASGTKEEGDRRGGEDGPGGFMPRSTGPWSDFRIIPCTDGKARRTGSRVFPLAYGLPRGVGDGGSWRKGLARGASRSRVGMLKGSGNAIVPALAAEFVRAFVDATK